MWQQLQCESNGQQKWESLTWEMYTRRKLAMKSKMLLWWWVEYDVGYRELVQNMVQSERKYMGSSWEHNWEIICTFGHINTEDEVCGKGKDDAKTATMECRTRWYCEFIRDGCDNVGGKCVVLSDDGDDKYADKQWVGMVAMRGMRTINFVGGGRESFIIIWGIMGVICVWMRPATGVQRNM